MPDLEVREAFYKRVFVYEEDTFTLTCCWVDAVRDLGNILGGPSIIFSIPRPIIFCLTPRISEHVHLLLNISIGIGELKSVDEGELVHGN